MTFERMRMNGLIIFFSRVLLCVFVYELVFGTQRHFDDMVNVIYNKLGVN